MDALRRSIEADSDVLVLADSIALDLFLALDDVTSDSVHHLALQAIAGRAVQGVETGPSR
jgi:hypothetical protein